MSEKRNILEMVAITKTFPGVVANDAVNFSLVEGEIHALVGENGAGKSTLMKIAAGIYRQDAGDILVEGKKRIFRSPQDAFSCGISAVHQEFMLVTSLTVLENIVLGFEPRRALGFLDWQKASQSITQLAQKYGMPIPLQATVASLPVAVQQQVEILKALHKNTRILIMDEPTAVLTPQEINDLFRALNTLRQMGTTIVFVTHKLNEVLSIADRVTVMRAGRVQGTLPVSQVSEEELARMMVGRDVVFRIRKLDKTIDPNAEVLGLRDLTVQGSSGVPALRNINLTVHPGEILGVAGVAGNGQTELVEVITGSRQPDSGQIHLHGEKFGYISTRHFRQESSYVCQDRRQIGSSPNQSLWENVLIGLEGKPQFSTPIGFLRRKSILQYTRQIMDRFDVRAPSYWTPAGTLSGGNLQKLILGRELAKNPSLLVAEDPTRGLDVGATEYIRNQILQFAAGGKGVLLVSQDLNELLMLSDRIVVLFKGELVGQLEGEAATPEEVGLYMLGVKRSEVAEKVMP